MSTPPTTPTPDPTILEVVSSRLGAEFGTWPGDLERIASALESAAVDPGVSVARLREDLEIAQRAREFKPLNPPDGSDEWCDGYRSAFNAVVRHIVGGSE